MAEQHHQTVSIETVTLQVKDLEKVSQFYQEIIGLSVLSEDKQHIALGIDENKEPLIILTAEGEYELVTGPRNGLFHIALLLPSRADLGDVLKRWIEAGYRDIGASDHGYSEALYIQDPEDNGIEIYVDKDPSEWDINADGSVNGITIPMDAQGVYASRHEQTPKKLPVGTFIGHLHLSSEHIEAFDRYYHEVLNLRQQATLPNAHFYSYDGYHHHFAINNWDVEKMIPHKDQHTGMASYTLHYHDDTLFQKITDSLLADNRIISIENNVVYAKDPNDITLILKK